MNLFTCTARLGKDAEVRVTKAGMSVCTFTGAVDVGYGDKKKTLWVRFALFGKRAEGNLPSYLTKGTQVAVSGELMTNEWESEGQKRFSLECNVNSLDLIGARTEMQSRPTSAAVVDEFMDDDLPF